MTTQHRNEKQIFFTAIEKTTPQERAAFIESECAGDSELLQRVNLLLESHDESLGPLDAPPPGVVATQTMPPITDKPGTQIGPYKLREQIGEGGFGVVYVAEQVEPVARKVALKIIKPGMDTKDVIARFGAELQTLALMDHPNIAKVLDAGTTDSGRPYFVMELIKGIPITEFCDEQKLSTRERLLLFVDVCRAVQHAHQKGIIHRDLKPSNIMVTMRDNRAIPKVIDFGVSKALSRKLTDKTVYTAFGQMIGTPLYMSPEQAEMTSLDIDTRSDIYSLGVLLYELLTGSTPFEREKLKQAGYDEMRRIIREDEPPNPSARISTLGEMITTVSEKRGTDPRRLSQTVRGDLDWIVMKALEKDRNRRYESASAFAADVRRYLNDEPIKARPPSTIYRMTKYARRNKATLVTMVLVATSLLAGTAVSLWQARVAHRRFLAEKDVRQDADSAMKDAQRSAEQTQAAMEFLTEDMIGGIEPNKARNPNLTMREALDRAAARVGEAFVDKPLSEATVRYFIGKAFWELQAYNKAKPHAELALKLRRRHLGQEHPETLRSMRLLAAVLMTQRKYAESRKLFEETIRLYRRIRGLEDRSTLVAMNNLGILLKIQREYEAAENLFEETLKTLRIVVGSEDRLTLGTMNNLATVLHAQSKHEEARKLYEETLKLMQQALGLEDPWTQNVMNNLAEILKEQGKYVEARKLHEETLELRRRVQGPEYPGTLESMCNLANVLKAQGKYVESRKLHEETLELKRRILGAEHPSTLSSMQNLANVLMAQGKYVESHKLHEETLELKRRILGAEHHATLNSMQNLANLLRRQDKYIEALKLAEETLKLMRRVLGPEHPDTLRSMNTLAIILHDQGKNTEAQKLFGETLMLQRQVLGIEHSDTLSTMTELAGSLREQRQYAKAKKLYEETLILQRRVLGPEQRQTLVTMHNLALLLQREGKYQESGKLYEETLKISRRILGSDHPNTLKTMNNLAFVLMQEGRYAEVEKLFEELVKLRRRVLGAEHPDTLGLMYDLANVLSKQRKFEEARHLFEETLKLMRRVLGKEHSSTLSTMNNLASMLFDQGKYAEAQKLFEEALELNRRIHGPEHSSTLLTMYNLANTLYVQGRYAESYKLFEETRRLRERVLGAKHPHTLHSMSKLAWILATIPDEQFRDPKKAIEITQKLVKLKPLEGNLWNTLGVAYYRADDFQSAIEALEKSMELRSGGDPNDWLFLAMIEWRLDNKQKAREWYEQSVRWMEERRTTNPELIRFRDEAANLLGLAIAAPNKMKLPLFAPRPKSRDSEPRVSTSGPFNRSLTVAALMKDDITRPPESQRFRGSEFGKKSAGEGPLATNHLTGPASPGRTVCAPEARIFHYIADRTL